MRQLAATVQVMERDWKGRPVRWAVQCTGGCREGCERHLVFLARNRGVFHCDCPGGRRGLVCRHVRAVWRSERAKADRLASFWPDETSARRQRRPWKTLKTGGQVYYVTERRTR